MTKTVLSIDWDFFYWRGLEAKVPKITLPSGEEISAVWLYDWGHSEGHGAFIQNAMWSNRWNGFEKNGLDPKVMTGVREDMGCTQPKVFVDKLCDRFDFDDAFLWYADSHAMGYLSVKEAYLHNGEKPVRVVHFDAHADMGYDEDKVLHEEETGFVDCASWLYHAIKNGLVSEAIIVYPDWRDEYDRDSLLETDYFKQVADQVKFFWWSDWVKETQDQDLEPIVMTNVARSGAWTPPWFDQQFEDFLNRIPWDDSTCLDCTELAGPTPGDGDACTVREFKPLNYDELYEIAEMEPGAEKDRRTKEALS